MVNFVYFEQVASAEIYQQNIYQFKKELYLSATVTTLYVKQQLLQHICYVYVLF